MKRSPIKRRTKPRRGQPTRAEKSAIRLAVYKRDKGLCQLRLHEMCSRDRVLPYDGDLFHRAHLVHIKSRGAEGTWELDNLLIGCPNCHMISVHQQGVKPVVPERPKK